MQNKKHARAFDGAADAACAPRAVQVGDRVLWGVQVVDVRHRRQVQAARGCRRGQQERGPVVPERVQRLCSCTCGLRVHQRDLEVLTTP